jgi:2-O-methyltransferase
LRITIPNIRYGIQHPLRALRYLRFRDVISYVEIDRHLPCNPVVLEAGAHDGTNTIEMAQFWPGATVHAFEPVPATFSKLRDKCIRFADRVTCWNLGLGPSSARLDLHVSGGEHSGTQSSSFLPPTKVQAREFEFVKFTEKVEVEVVSIDDWAGSNRIEKIDFLWLDMQGFELEALGGAENTLKFVAAIHIEVSHLPLYEGAPLYHDVKAWMQQRGFRPVCEATFRVGGNVLFVRSDSVL